MYGEVKIGDKKVPMLSMASCDIYYERIFNEDPLRIQVTAGDDGATAVQLFMKMGFVMAKFAELKSREKMRELNEDDYLDWLDQFDRADYQEALADVADVYNGQKQEKSTPKKEKDQ